MGAIQHLTWVSLSRLTLGVRLESPTYECDKMSQLASVPVRPDLSHLFFSCSIEELPLN